MSAALLLDRVRQKMPLTEIASEEETRHLLRVLAFKFGHLHTNHYYKVAHRDDVVHHRSLFAPFYRTLLEDRKVWLLTADASFFHQNAKRGLSWFPLDVENGDLADFGTGTGQRLNVWEFCSESGILTFADGSGLSRSTSIQLL